MCFDLDSQPPVQPLLGSDARGELLTLTSADGTPFAAYRAHADTARRTGAGIVILPDVRGLFQFYQDLAMRFAEAGVEAITIDYFGRTAGLTARDDAFEFWPHVQQTKAPQIRDDVAAALAQLRVAPTRQPRTSPSASASAAPTPSTRRPTALGLRASSVSMARPPARDRKALPRQ